jgi:hypothetical protein
MGLSSTTGLFNRAADIYGVDDIVMRKRPRQKFNFSVFMQIDSAPTLSDESYGRAFQFEKVVSVSMPDYQYNVVKVNQYNQMRPVTTRQEITPASIIFYDTVDNQFQSLLTDYSRYYYSQGLGPIQQLAPNATNTQVDSLFGLTATQALGRFFFNQINIVTIDNTVNGVQEGRTVSMMNCLITNASHDTLSYNDSGLMTWTVQFTPEHVSFNT